jgi:hypothetical protein
MQAAATIQYAIHVESNDGEEKNKGELKASSGELTSIDLKNLVVDITPTLKGDGRILLKLTVHERGSEVSLYTSTVQTVVNEEAGLKANLKATEYGPLKVDVGLKPLAPR